MNPRKGKVESFSKETNEFVITTIVENSISVKPEIHDQFLTVFSLQSKTDRVFSKN